MSERFNARAMNPITAPLWGLQRVRRQWRRLERFWQAQLGNNNNNSPDLAGLDSSSRAIHIGGRNTGAQRPGEQISLQVKQITEAAFARLRAHTHGVWLVWSWRAGGPFA